MDHRLERQNPGGLEKALKPYIAKATEQGRRAVSSSRKTARRVPRTDLAAVREWAKSNGHQVSDRGLISASVQQAYDAARYQLMTPMIATRRGEAARCCKLVDGQLSGPARPGFNAQGSGYDVGHRFEANPL